MAVPIIGLRMLSNRAAKRCSSLAIFKLCHYPVITAVIVLCTYIAGEAWAHESHWAHGLPDMRSCNIKPEAAFKDMQLQHHQGDACSLIRVKICAAKKEGVPCAGHVCNCFNACYKD